MNYRIKALLASRVFWFSMMILAMGILLNNIFSVLIPLIYGYDIPILQDLIMDNMPFWNVCWIYDLAPMTGVLLFFVYAYFKDWQKLPYFLLVFGIIQILRACFIIMTALGTPNLDTFNGIFQFIVMRNGVFPSGHTGIVFLAFLFTKAKIIRRILLFLTILTILALLLSRGHYSIDIFAALLFSYAAYMFGEKHLKEMFTIKEAKKSLA